MALDTVQDYIIAARTLLQDEMEPSRYSDGEIAEAIGFGLMEARKLRPELFMGRMNNIPDINRDTPTTEAVVFDVQYRNALLFHTIGYVMLRDEEEVAKADAAGYLNRFVAKLLTIAA